MINLKKIFLFIFLFFQITLLYAQLNKEGREFIQTFFYDLPVNVTKIQTINVLSKNSERFTNYSATDQSFLVFPKKHPYFMLTNRQKTYKTPLVLYQWHEKETQKSYSKRLIIYQLGDFSLYYHLRTLFSSISFTTEQIYHKDVDVPETEFIYKSYFFDSQARRISQEPFAIIYIHIWPYTLEQYQNSIVVSLQESFLTK